MQEGKVFAIFKNRLIIRGSCLVLYWPETIPISGHFLMKQCIIVCFDTTEYTETLLICYETTNLTLET